jgi:flagellar hook-associated protein 1 FlgK
MPVSTFGGLQTALRGLLAQQRALDVTSHNVANANTVGYSRQEATMVASTALRLPAGALQDGSGADLGTGVEVQSYRRIRDSFLDLQFRAQAMRLGGLATQARSLEQVEVALAEPGETGIAAQLQRFWSGWGSLGNAAESPGARQALVGQAQTLVTGISALAGQLATAAAQAGDEYAQIAGATGEVRQIADELAQLNAAISSAIGSRVEPNDLYDRRDVLLDRLSALAQVSTTDLGDGTIEVVFGDAPVPLVAGSTVTWPQALTDPKGKLGALIELSSPTGAIAAYAADLDNVARQLADSVNALHTSGGGPPFFSYTAGNEAATIAVAVTAAGVVTSTTGSPGDNDIARGISNLRGGAADQAYSTLVSRIGNEVREVLRGEANADALVAAVQDRRDSISGVSLDEEMTGLVRFQRAYQASARAMSTLDEALDVLINRTGRVGL